MNTIWSTYIQSIGTLYESRKLRFSDIFKNKYMPFFEIEKEAKICEIGCGPGALTEALYRWYPDANIYGIDRDSNFIKFAQKNTLKINYVEGDATCLPFDNDCFDITISNTVVEHIAPADFYGEQYRILKKGGSCLVLSARKGVSIVAPCILEESEFEKNIWKRTNKYFEDIMKKNAICAYPQSEAELPICMEKYGFKNVITEYITINLTPDNPIYSREMAYSMINANRRNALDNIESLLLIAPEVVTATEIDKMKELTNIKYDKRIELYDLGIKQWDTNMSLIMMLKGTK